MKLERTIRGQAALPDLFLFNVVTLILGIKTQLPAWILVVRYASE